MRNTSPMNILHLTAPAVVGGLESVVLDLATELQALGHRPILAAIMGASERDASFAGRARARGVEVVPLILPPRRYHLEIRAVTDLLKTLAPDVIHTHGYRADVVGGLAARRLGIPWISTAHGFTGGGARARLYEWLQVRMLRHAHRVLAVSRPIRERLVGEGVDPAIVSLLPNSWSPKPLLTRTTARQQLGIPQDALVIGWVGRLTQEKGPDVFLRALTEFRNTIWQASVIGDGPTRGSLEEQARALGIAERIRWHGIVAEAASFYRAFDVWVLTSRTEGTPIALFEAVGALVPVVATAVGGVPDVVSKEQALLVPSERPDAIARALESVLADPSAAAARAASAARRLEVGFAVKQWIAAHLAIYRSVVIER